MKKQSIIKKKISRVDYQVSFIIALIVTLSFLCVYFYNYEITYSDMLYSLKERSDNIYSLVEKEFYKTTFDEINTRKDMNKDIYQTDKQLLEYIKDATGVRYLYTAKKNQSGDFIYVLDGLSSESDDFRYPGDLIEEETIPELKSAYLNKIVYPEDIKNTSWGKIFVSYYPIHQGDEVIGVIGIEFNADHQWNSFAKLRIMTPIIGFVFAILAIIISVKLFRRISNPTYRDLANTDYLTDISNRNAFELFMLNTKAKGKDFYQNLGFISIDLNDLKIINDRDGHQAGDRYIQSSALILKQFETAQNCLYRIGGDEFVFVLMDTDVERINTLKRQICKAVVDYDKHNQMDVSIAIGVAVYDDQQDASLQDAFNRADANMYINKSKIKASRKNITKL